MFVCFFVCLKTELHITQDGLELNGYRRTDLTPDPPASAAFQGFQVCVQPGQIQSFSGNVKTILNLDYRGSCEVRVLSVRWYASQR